MYIFAGSPIGLWPLSSQYKGADLSGNGNGITLVGTSFADNAVVFAGTTSSYGKISASPSLQLQQQFTWMAEYYPDSDKVGPLFDYFVQGEWGLHIWYNNRKLFVRPSYHGASTPPEAQSTTPLVTQQWNKIGLSIDSEVGVIKMIVNGAEDRFEKSEWIGNISHTDGNVFVSSVYVSCDYVLM